MRLKRKRYLLVPVLTAAAAGVSPLPASAQAVSGPPAILPIIDKPCDRSGEEIVVCGRRERPRSPYRLPEPPPRFDAGGGDESVSRERHGLYEQGDTGIHSCSTVGPGGYTGCSFRAWKDSDEQWGGKDRGNRVRPGDAPE
jgi:hypothetical protein